MNAHAREIKRYIDNGYFQFGFNKFLRVVKYLDAIDGLSNANEMFLKVRKLQKNKIDNIFLDILINNFIKNGESEDSSKSDAKSERFLIDSCLCVWKFVPDCFILNDKTIEIIEVTSQHELTFDKLLGYSEIDEVLWNYSGLRMRCFEHEVRGNVIKEHDLNLIHEFYEMIPCRDSTKIDIGKVIKTYEEEYLRIWRGESELFSKTKPFYSTIVSESA